MVLALVFLIWIPVMAFLSNAPDVTAAGVAAFVVLDLAVSLGFARLFHRRAQ